MISDLLNVFYWWFILFGLGLVFLPLTAKIFKNFFDKGYLFSKVIAIAVLSYVIWLGAHLKITPFTQAEILVITGFSALIITLISLKTSSFKGKIANLWLIFIGEELMFLLALIFWSFIRGLQPNIQGLEKFMDFGFVNSILKSRYFPPADMWFAGHSINYYYYGHYITAFLTKLSGLNSAITYNLMIATLFAFTFSLTFSLTSNLAFFALKKKGKKSLMTKDQRPTTIVIAGLLSAFLICFASNLHTPLYNLKNSPQKYWYPDATRYIGYNPPTNDKTIHEFPAYSFVVADLHGHVSDIPFVLLFIALTLNLFLNFLRNPKEKFLIFNFGLLTFNLSLMYMTNAWDLPIYLLFSGIVLLIANRLIFKKKYYQIIIKTALPLIAIVIGWFIFTLPFNLNFDQIPQGVSLVHNHTPFYQLLILWGGFGLIAITFIISFFLYHHHIFTDFFSLSLIITATLLIIIPEIVYVKDIYSGDYYRANTMFKFTYQAYIIMAILVGYVITKVLTKTKKIYFKVPPYTLYSLLYACLLIYPLFSLPGYYGKISISNYKGLYGLNFLAQNYPEDYQAILWLKKNIDNQSIILEAPGDSYTDYCRVSATTGLPTIEGWIVHEWLWRGGYDLPTQRAAQVEQIYQSADIRVAQELLREYSVEYLFFGQLEKEKYPQAKQERLEQLGKPIYQAGRTVIYKINF